LIVKGPKRSTEQYENAGDEKRWKFVQEVINTFWRKWHRDYFPTLIVRQKWHTNKRNLQVGDIVHKA
jgi:hypothetical protein